VEVVYSETKKNIEADLRRDWAEKKKGMKDEQVELLEAQAAGDTSGKDVDMDVEGNGLHPLQTLHTDAQSSKAGELEVADSQLQAEDSQLQFEDSQLQFEDSQLQFEDSQQYMDLQILAESGKGTEIVCSDSSDEDEDEDDAEPYDYDEAYGTKQETEGLVDVEPAKKKRKKIETKLEVLQAK